MNPVKFLHNCPYGSCVHPGVLLPKYNLGIHWPWLRSRGILERRLANYPRKVHRLTSLPTFTHTWFISKLPIRLADSNELNSAFSADTNVGGKADMLQNVCEESEVCVMVSEPAIVQLPDAALSRSAQAIEAWNLGSE